MLIVGNRGYKRRYVYGGAGIIDTIKNFFISLLTSNAAKQMASTAMEAGKNAAISAGQKMVEKGVKKILTPKSKSIINKYTQQPSSFDPYEINNLIQGSGNAIAIQDLVKELNGSGIKLT